MKPTLTGKNILIMGLGRSGQAAARFAAAQGASVTATDASASPAPDEVLESLGALGIELALGGHPQKVFDRADLIVLSPGVPHTLAPLEQARRRGIAVVGEMELAARFVHEPVVAVTGTNGKTTTTELLGKMLTASGRRVFVGGNIGTPLMGHLLDPKPVDVLVLEVSSFQIDTMDRFRPEVAVLLNITQDHLDRYPDFDAYAASKARLFRNQKETDTAVINGCDPLIRGLALPSRRLPFYDEPPGKHAETDPGAWIRENEIRIRTLAGQKVSIKLEQTPLTGGHNRENIAAAALAALAAGATAAGIQSALDRFTGLAHRLETVAVIDGVSYVDDSKATNVDAAVRALDAFQSPVVMILGGRDKGGDYAPLVQRVQGRARQLILLGEAADRLDRAMAGQVPTRRAENMAQAVAQARQAARPGDVVLLSPACASFDMYDNYAQRGDDFRSKVREGA